MPPVAFLGSMHTCPMVTVLVPHVGGPVMPIPMGPPILVGGMPIATATSMCICVGPPDLVAMGSTTVLAWGMPVARMGDQTAHGGVILLGNPTVMVGG